MAKTPLFASDFYKDDGAVETGTKQLKALREEYEKLLKLTKNETNKLVSEVKKYNSATADGRKNIDQAAEDAKKLKKAQDAYKDSLKKTNDDIVKLQQQRVKNNQMRKLEVKLNASAVGSYDKLSAQYSINKIKLNAMGREMRKTTVEGKKLEKESKLIREEMKQQQAATGNNTLEVGSYKDAIASLPGPLANTVGGLKAVGVQMLKLLANPFVATVALIAALFIALVKAMKRSEDGQDRLNKVMTVAGAIFDNIMDILTLIAVALFDTFPKILKKTGNAFVIFAKLVEAGFLQVKLRWNEFIGATKKANEVRKRLAEVNTEVKDLRTEQKKLGKEISEGFSEAANKAKNFRKELEEDIKAAQRLADAEAKFNRDERRFLVENAKLAKESAKLRTDSETLKKVAAEESIKLLEKSFAIDEKVLNNELDIAKQRASILRQKSQLAVDDIETKREIAEAEANVFAIETRFDELRRQRVRRLNILRLEAFKQEQERAKASVKIAKLEQAEVVRKNNAIVKSDKNSFNERIKALNENALLQSQVLRDATAIEISALDKRKELKLINDKDYAIQKNLIDAKLTDDLLKLAEKQEIQRKQVLESDIAARLKLFDTVQALEQSKFDLLKKTEKEKTDFALKAEKARLLKIIELNKTLGGQLSDVQLQTMKNAIAKIDQELAAVDPKGRDIYEIVGLKLNDEAKQAISDSLNFGISQVFAFADAQIAAADRVVASTTKEKDAKRQALQDAKADRAAGFASNVELAEKELKAAEKLEKEALKNQEKAQKQRIILESVAQAANLVTASTKIWKDLGFPFAIPAIAVMWGSFIASKAKALQVTKVKSEKGSVEYLDYGSSHASGNDIAIGHTRTGALRTAERGEMMGIISKKMTKKYGVGTIKDVITSINDGVFFENFKSSFTPDPEILNNIEVVNEGIDMRQITKDVSDIKNRARTYTDAQGRTIEIYKNRTRIITTK